MHINTLSPMWQEELLAFEHKQFEVDCHKIDCYFEPYAGGLHFAFVGTHEIYLLLSAEVIACLERQFEPYAAQESHYV